ncbi:dihydroneopterin aldolase [Zoogloea sp.]|uniref:dihydroneopterin aldolase n=1 Tax=Zoogloea sp. TaxID=49181 RepID=UPI002605F6BC|nr:dihydroneopterin aldolase [Zoogloea sp.]MDD3353001.1 dihydroneopterin aldolase [Zoogloea sp.]
MEHDCLIRLEGLCLDASIGIYPQELAARQPLEIDLQLTIDGTLAARSDDIRHTVDYDQVVDCLEALLASRHFQLLEYLSQAMLDTLADSFPVKRAEVTVAKPLAVPKARRVSVTRMAEWRREAVKAVPLAL